ncbi:MAG: hypothetical protein JWQ49_3642 [Edaphobacter sp.]|nr:hypothetical protein [Edaphobacter sp.]
MVWSLLLLASIFLAIKFRAFRFALLATIGLIVATIALYIAHDKTETESSKHLVLADQLAFTDLRLGPDNYGSSYRLTGRLKNKSPYSVFEVRARIRILDCDSQSHCDVVGEEETSIGPLIPPAQVRDIDESVYFGSETRIRGQLQWNYEITEIRARS